MANVRLKQFTIEPRSEEERRRAAEQAQPFVKQVDEQLGDYQMPDPESSPPARQQALEALVRGEKSPGQQQIEEGESEALSAEEEIKQRPRQGAQPEQDEQTEGSGSPPDYLARAAGELAVKDAGGPSTDVDTGELGQATPSVIADPMSEREQAEYESDQVPRWPSIVGAFLAQAARRPKQAQQIRQRYQQQKQEPLREYQRMKKAQAREQQQKMRQMKLQEAKQQLRHKQRMQDPQSEESQLFRDAFASAYPQQAQAMQERGVWEQLTPSNKTAMGLLEKAGVRRQEIAQGAAERRAELQQYAQKQQISNQADIAKQRQLHQMKLERAFAGSGSPGSGRVVDGQEQQQGYTGDRAPQTAHQVEVATLRARAQNAGVEEQVAPMLDKLEGGRFKTRSDQERAREQIESLIGEGLDREGREAKRRNDILEMQTQRAQDYEKRIREFEAANSAVREMNQVLNEVDNPEETLRQALLMGPKASEAMGNVDPDVAKVRRGLDMFQTEKIKKFAGARVSPEELSRIQSGLATGRLQNPEVFMDYFRGMQQGLNETKQRIDRAYPIGRWALDNPASVPPWLRNENEKVRIRIYNPETGKTVETGRISGQKFLSAQRNAAEKGYAVEEL
jgi:hypothetical protein